MRKLFNDEAGFVISAELVLVMTIAVLATVVGLSTVKDAITAELNDISEAFGVIDQSYSFRGMAAAANNAKGHGSAAGSAWSDRADDCDCKGLQHAEVCGKTQHGSANLESSTNP